MDSVVTSVVEKFKQRSEFGQRKYGTNLDRTDLSFLQWTTHMQEELMDAILYLEKLKKCSSEERAKRKCGACTENGEDRFNPGENCKVCFGTKRVD